MPAAISVIIPVGNAARSLPGCCAALMEGLEEGLLRELLVADMGSEDDSLRIADAMGGEAVRGPQALGDAVAQAKGQWLLLLRPETRLARGWTVPVADHLSAGQRPAHFRIVHDAPGLGVRLSASLTNLRSGLTGRAVPLQGLLAPRRVVEKAGVPGGRDPMAGLFRRVTGVGSLPAEIRVTG
ncbi:glycosyl transferase [Pseudooceanicola nanhaiensis]|uniref:glycosyl transferase n=1 Tax=Pseudooceanicola nanhaiensis TaxID=375761 RepID=UPI001CD81A73|nr:glycosyl transferase [Pseudooceanicola nanhaiensis]MCA0921999.1 glycosyl transferase [Pseudooceanicola nanhaiensis]